MKTIMKITSISTLHEILGVKKPENPLITLIHLKGISFSNCEDQMEYALGLFTILLTDRAGFNCAEHIDAENEDGQERKVSLKFTFPGQRMLIDPKVDLSEDGGWILCFQPELISGTIFEEKLGMYDFFDYKVNEPVRLTEKDKSIIENIAMRIVLEYSENIDIYSNDLLLSYLELLLNKCKRFHNKKN